MVFESTTFRDNVTEDIVNTSGYLRLNNV